MMILQNKIHDSYNNINRNDNYNNDLYLWDLTNEVCILWKPLPLFLKVL
jgi:hypothetical protein